MKSLENETVLFKSHGVGSQWFYRHSLVDSICNDLLGSVENSTYCKGPPGCGKSTLLALIGRELIIRGCIVYILCASEVEKYESELLATLQGQPKDKTCVLLIDEASMVSYKEPIWVKLFKDASDNNITNVRILGVGIPSLNGTSVNYTIRKPISYLLMKTDSGDMNEFIDFWVNFANSRVSSSSPHEPVQISRDAVAEVCKWLCDYTNGHMYLLVSFCRILFSKPDLTSILCNYVDLFTSSDFFLMMDSCRHRCQLNGNSLPQHEYYSYLFDRDSEGFRQSVTTLSKLGYLDENSCKFFSDYVLCCFQNVSRIYDDRTLELSATYGVAEKRIIGGLRRMKETDFFAEIGGPSNLPSVEDAVSQRWSYYVMSDLPNVFVSPQNRTLSKKGRVDFLFNGLEQIAIEVALNGSRHIYVEKLDKFLSADGVYKQWRNSFAIFNIVTDSTKRKDISGIPEDRLKYLFEFNVQTNTLYRGDMKEPLLVPVSSRLPTPPSISGIAM